MDDSLQGDLLWSPIMEDKHDGARSSNRSSPSTALDRPKAQELRLLNVNERHESPDSYNDFFEQLQIKPCLYEDFFNEVIHPVRQKHMELLKRGTDSSIRSLTTFLIRGYGYIVWPLGSTWLVDVSEDERLVYERGNYKHERLHAILEPMFLRMREVIFEVKPEPKARAGQGRTILAPRSRDREDAYEAENDTDAIEHPAPVEKARTQTLKRIEKMLEKAPEPEHRSVITAKQTEDGIIRLIETLSDLRANSDQEVFARLWQQHIGRLDEVDCALDASIIHSEHTELPVNDGDEVMSDQLTPLVQINQTTTSNLVERNNAFGDPNLKVSPFSAKSQRITHSLNLSNEPFASNGVPLPQPWPRPLEPQLPATMSVFIQTSPPEGMYKDRSYHWLDAGVRLVDQLSFFNGVMMRIGMSEQQVTGYVFSYGWNDVSRWIPQGMERHGWGVLQDDLKKSADLGMRIWRMKMLVVGHQVAGHLV